MASEFEDKMKDLRNNFAQEQKKKLELENKNILVNFVMIDIMMMPKERLIKMITLKLVAN